MSVETRNYSNGTYLKVENPFGFYIGGRAECADGKVRNLKRISVTADTYFSVPAAVTVKGKTVSGYITVECGSGSSVPTEYDPLVVIFKAYKWGKNYHLLLDDTVTLRP